MKMAEFSLIQVKKVMGRGEIPCYEQFSFSLIVLKRLVLHKCKNLEATMHEGVSSRNNMH